MLLRGDIWSNRFSLIFCIVLGQCILAVNGHGIHDLLQNLGQFHEEGDLLQNLQQIHGEDMNTETACEGKTLDLRCKKGMTIDIESAMYGRLSSKTCKAGRNINTINCASRKSTDKVKKICNRHRRCKVRASNREMGDDPCHGVTKYLSVRYACVGPVIGEAPESTKYLGCFKDAKDRLMKIKTPDRPHDMSAELCRDFCGDYRYFAMQYGKECFCGNDFSRELKKSKKCNMDCPGSSGICGGSWSLSLFEVDNPPAQRQCSGPDDILYFGQCQCTICKNMNTETACEGKTLDLRCKKGMTIDIKSAMYGRLSSKTCKAGRNINTINCASRKSIDKVKKICNRHRRCKVRASNREMGDDPCNGVTKYLSVRYACVGPVIGEAPESTKYLGCFKDAKDRLMKIKTPDRPHDMSAELCRDFCGDYRYFAMQYGKECFCGNDFSRELKKSKKCNMDCPGSSGICGGSWSLSLFEVDNPPAQRQCSGPDDILYFGQCQCTICKNMNTETACEGKTLDLRCKKGMTIDIKSAMYGRLSSKTCKAGRNINTINCTSRKSIDKVKKICNRHRRCKVRASNREMGDDPCNGVTKYLSVRYACVGPVIGEAPESTKYLGCFKDSKNRLMKIRTPDGPHDMSAELCKRFCGDYRYFAMQYRKECFCANEFSRDLEESKKCTMGCPGSSGICGGSWSLSLYEVDNPPAQRQCSGPNDIIYFGQCQCTICKNMNTETACEGKTLNLRCKKGMTIDIESAIYGRLSSKTCKAGRNINTINCASRKSTDKVKKICNRHRRCKVRASNREMGDDPCYGVTKYLSVRYACVGPVIGGEAPESTKYLGCFKDSKNRLMKIRTPDGPHDMSAELCKRFCGDYRYFAMQYRKECFCANEFSRDLEESKKCTMGCPGSSGICGGSWSLSLYEVDNPPARRQCSGPNDIIYFGQCQCTICKKCECMAWGDVHYEPFDGVRKNFQGICTYTASKSKADFPDVDCFFQLDVKNERRNSKPVSYTTRVLFTIGQKKIRLEQDCGLKINGIEFFEPVNLIDEGITITKEGSNLMVYSKKCNIAVEWDCRAKLTLVIPERFGPFVEGICGNCDGTVDPEILLDGTDVSGLSKYERDWELSSQWEIYDDSEELKECKRQQQFICTEKQKTLIAGNNYCGYLKSGRGSPFELGLTQFPEKSKTYYDDCEFDICSNLGTANEEYAKCRAIEGFVTFCNSKDIRDLEWRTSTFCPRKCNDNEQYNEGDFCEATCSDPGNCVQQAAGCQCEQGYLRDNQHCVHQSRCGCTTDDGFYFPIGKKRYWDDCTKIEECHEGSKMVPIMEHAEGCHENAMCEPEDGAYKCKCKTGYRGDGINKCKELHPACIKTVQVRCIRSGRRKAKSCKVKNAEMIRSVQLMYSHGNHRNHKNHRNHRNRGQPECILNVNLFLSKKGNKFVIKRRCSGTFRVTYEGKGDKCDTSCGINAEEVNGHCRCPDGYTGNPKIECTDTCTCVSSGDPHIKTYDSAMIHFMGLCKYTLSKHTNDNDECFFNVETTLERRNDRPVSYNREVHVDYGTETIYSILQGGVVMVNGMGPVSLPQYQLENGNVEITVTGNFVTIRHIPCEIEVMFDGRHMAVVNVPFAEFSSLVTGLCGNCNGNKRDDYSTKEGELVGKQRKHHHQIGNSFKVELGTDPRCKDAPELPKCSRDRKKKAASKRFCGLLKKRRGPFENAFDVKKLNFEGLFESCVFDVCLLPDDTDIHCQTLEETVYLANQYQITIDPIWREITNCPFEECDVANGFVYSATATCTNTCMEPDADQNCNMFPHEACVCEDGKVLKDGICVLPEDCTEECVTDMGITVNEGEVFPADAECGPVQKCSRVDGSLVLVEENKICQGAFRICPDDKCICAPLTIQSNGEPDSDCVQSNVQEEIVCEGNNLDISCKNGMKIYIKDAVYGRSNKYTCLHRSKIRTTNCASKISTDKVKQKCNGHRNCKLRASNLEMGDDPCFGTTKYLHVKYVCEAMPPVDAPKDTTYIGCYKDSKDRLMKIKTPDGPNDMSAELCRGFCTDYRYFGMQYRKECFCANEFSRDLEESNKCDMGCPGSSEICGGSWALSLYEVNNPPTQRQCTGPTDIFYFGQCRCTVCKKCECMAWGDVHYEPFDGGRINFQGACKYTMSKSKGEFPDVDCFFQLDVKNAHRNSKPVSYTIEVFMKIGQTEIHLKQNGIIKVNGIEFFEPVNLSGEGITITKEGSNLMLYSRKCDITVEWDGRAKLTLVIPGRFGPFVEGICGNCDGTVDPKILLDGTDVSGLGQHEQHWELGNQWEIYDELEELEECNTSPQFICPEEQKTLMAGNDYCGILKSGRGSTLELCLTQFPEKSKIFYDDCEFDICSNLGTANEEYAKCRAIEGFVTFCNSEEIRDLEWRTSTLCPHKCKDNEQYNEGDFCEATCSDPGNCVQQAAGCQCEQGYLRDNQHCVHQSRCGCTTDDGFYFPIGKKRYWDDCTRIEECREGGKMVPIMEHAEGCHKNAMCEAIDGAYKCKCKTGYRGDGINKCKEIPPLCIRTVRVRCQSRGRKGKACKVKNAEMIRSVQLLYSHGHGHGRRHHGQPKCILGKALFISKKGNKFIVKHGCSGTFEVTYEAKGDNCDTSCGINAEEVNGHCRCPDGYTGNPKIECTDMCTCVSSGDPHIQTYDSAMIHFMGLCKYTLSKHTNDNDACFFNVETTLERRNDRPVSYNGEVHVNFGTGIIYSIKKDGVVMVNDRGAVSLPQYQLENGDVEITVNGHFVTIRHIPCKIEVKFDGRHMAVVKVPFVGFSSMLTGLCGNCNGNKRDDYSTKEGELVGKQRKHHHKIGNSYKVELATDPPCKDAPELPKCSRDRKKKAASKQFCGLLKKRHGPFKDAFDVKKLNFEGLFESCVFDVCLLPDDTDIHCQTLEEAVYLANQYQITIDPIWRERTNCPFEECDAANGFVYSATATCTNICMEPDADQNCDVFPHEACVCEDGKVLKDGVCVLPEECTEECVTDMGITINEGEIFPVDAQCGPAQRCSRVDSSLVLVDENKMCQGALRECKNALCSCPLSTFPSSDETDSDCLHFDGIWSDWSEPSKCSVTCGGGVQTIERSCNNPAPLHGGKPCEGDKTQTQKCNEQACPEECVCATYGDPHVKTFDGVAMKFQGICRYTLSKSDASVCPFNVEVQHERRYGKTKVSYNKYLVFEIYGKSFRMEKNYKLMMDDEFITVLGYMLDGRIFISYLPGGLLAIEAVECGVKVMWDGRHMGVVAVPRPDHLGHLSGMCGDCDRNKDNDLTTKDGQNVAHLGNKAYTLVGDSFVVLTSSGKPIGCPQIKTPPTPKCPDSVAAEKKCAMLKKDNAGSPFKACMDKYDAEVKFDDMFDACVFDACESGKSAELLCDSFEFAENECEKNTETVHWRTENLCPMHCQGDMEFKDEVACIPSCEERECNEAPRPGCTCPEGTVLLDAQSGTCVPRDKCEYCQNADGVKVMLHDTLNKGNCKATKKCVPNDPLPQLQDKAAVPCQQSEVCEPDGSMVYSCRDCSTKECGKNAECYIDAQNQMRKCRCMDGYSGKAETGFECFKPTTPPPEPTTTEPHSSSYCEPCHENAECKPIYPGSSKYSCQCTDPFIGDGVNYCDLVSTPMTPALPPPPVDGIWSDWSEASECSVTCGGGVQKMERSCNNPAPLHGGKPCEGDKTQKQKCNEQACPVDGIWSDWSEASECSVTCGGGVQKMERSCNNPAPLHGGKPCEGDKTQKQKCNKQACPVDGIWSDWSEASECSVTCGGGVQKMERSCNNPAPLHGGKPCEGDKTQKQKCNKQACPVDGIWSDWSEASECSVTCGGGVQKMERSCNNPAPLHGGKPCEGDKTQKQKCNKQACPVDGIWSDWSEASECSVTCGGGVQKMERSCNNPAPLHGGKPCEGDKTQKQKCNKQACPVDGIWSDWSEASECSVTCGGGVQKMERSCNNPAPLHGGKPCEGDKTQKQKCNKQACPVDGIWSDWSEASECSVTCGGGVQKMERSCNNPAPLHGGKPCEGDKTQKQKCNKQACPVDGIWSDWSEASECSVTCGGGVQKMERSCNNPAPLHGGKPCEGDKTQKQKCNKQACPVDGIWSDWSEASECSVTCGGGVQKMERSCNNPAPLHGGKPCEGDKTQKQKCNKKACPVDGIWSDWSEASECSVTCGGGVQKMERSCNNPAPLHGGKPCEGDKTQKQKCNEQACPVDGIWSDWSEASACSVTCGGGLQTMERSCNNPAPLHGGKPCEGDKTQKQKCNNHACPEECVCATYGDPHVKTYDGVAMKFQGICRYTLSKSDASVCPFNVEVQHERRYGKTKVSYNKYLVFEIYGKSFRMEKNYKLMMDDEFITVLGYMLDGRIFISYLPGGLLAIEAVECGVKVMWDGRHMGVVAVPRPDHLGHLSGMCGDCDRNKDNDLTTKDGQNVAHLGNKAYTLVGDSFVVLTSSGKPIGCPQIKTPPTPKCPDSVAAEKKCAMLKKDNAGSPFKACMDKYDAEVKFDDMFDACVFDACESGKSAELLCDSFEFAENECEKNTETVHWRTENLCPMHCQGDMEFKDEVACIPSCEERECNEAPRPGCTCPEGTVLLDAQSGTCVPRDKCEYCQNADGVKVMLHDTLNKGNCKATKKCVPNDPLPQLQDKAAVPCQQSEVCEPDGSMVYSCRDCSTKECGKNAECYIDAQNQMRKCRCMDGYSGKAETGFECFKPTTPPPEPTTTEPHSSSYCEPCHENAECKPIYPGSSEFSCQCIYPYMGDGVNYCKMESELDTTTKTTTPPPTTTPTTTTTPEPTTPPPEPTTPPPEPTTPEPHSSSYCEPCHENAECKPIYPGSSEFSCQCIDPYVGDGVTYCDLGVTTQPEPIISAPEPTPEGYCMCSAIGVNQYILNDGQVIGNMKESCKYSAELTKHKDNSNEDCFFEVIVHNTFKKRFGLFSAVDSVEIQVNHLRVNLYQGSIAKVNGATVDLPFKQNNIYIVKSGGRLRMSSPCGLMVLFGGGKTTGSTVDVFVQKTLVTPLSGICGLCGTDLNIPDPVQYISKFSKKDEKKCIRVGKNLCPIRAGSGLCRDFIVNGRISPYKKPQDCSRSPFCDCFESSDLYAKMFEICAMYACLDPGMVCDISQSFMDRCRFNNKGYRYWKTSASYTPMCRKPECSKANMEYKDDTIACPATCTDRNPEASCMLPQISGCVCIENHVLSDGECIPISQCGGTVDEPIDGNWSDWSEASECSVTCGGGVQKMKRSCNNPAPLHGGKPCEGDKTQKQKCNKQACPVDGNWSDWSEPSECSVTCGGGVQKMERSCNNPAPLHGGKPCEGDKTRKQKCNKQACPVDGKWSDWSEPSECSVPCRGGVQIMKRSCNNPAPLHGGKPCEGDKTQTQKCNEQACPGDCESNNECDVNGFCDDGKCKCKKNYEGNGYDNCKQICVDSDCAKNAACKKGACKCNTGFVGNGNTLCKIKCGRKKCHENAICKKKRKCVCKNKFPYGDGVKRCSDMCNGKICVKNAECPRNKCKCKRRYYQILDEAGEMIECRKMCGRRNKCHRYASCEKRQCVCNPGYIGDGKLCHESCMCSAFGDPHVWRYSQSLVSFAGQCKYTLSRFLEIGDPCMFDVQVNYYKGQKTSDGAAMVEYVLLEMYGMVIQLGPHRQVMVDDQKVSLPFFSKNKDLSIRYMGFNMVVETKCFVKLQFNEAGVVILTIAKMYGDNVEGLCGACNGLKEWKIKGGDDVPDAASDKFSRIAQSFAVLEAGAVCKTTEIKACKAKFKRRAKSRRNCGTILNKIRHKQFKKCAAAYPGLVEMIKQTCYLDYCTNIKDKPSLKGVVCTSLETIIALCHYNGYGGIRWRSRRLCGKKCKRNERYRFKTIACPNNCVERKASRSCKIPKIEDCECKRGYVKSGDECVKYKRRKYPNCGCKKNGRYIKLDHSLISKDCSSEKTCTAKKNKPAKLKETSLQCHREAYCDLQKGIRSCMCLSDFKGDGINTCTPIEPSDGNSTQGICDLQENIIHCVKTVSMKGNCFYQSKYKDECQYHIAMSQNHHGDDTVIYSVNRNDGISRKRLLRGSKTDDCGNIEYDSSGYVKIIEKVCDCPTDHLDG